LSPQMEKRTIVIGDVHGCLAELDELLRKVQYKQNEDRLVFVGDLVDRGPDSVGVVRRVRELGAECVLGNHEEKHLRWRRWERKVAKGEAPKNPMRQFPKQKLEIQDGLSADDFRWLSKLPRTLRLGEHNGRQYVVVHGGMEPYRPFDKQSKQVIRIRYCNVETGNFVGSKFPGHVPDGTKYWAELWKGPESVIYGHAVNMNPDVARFDDHGEYVCWGIDTGCCFGGHLTALVMEPGSIGTSFVPVKAKETYADLPVGGFSE
jgi:bis(5'-nucleosyl)-tetraphosphatase (symmetrical)